MIYRPKWFSLYELVPKALYESVDHGKLWGFFDDRVLRASDIIRDLYGPMEVNNWYGGGIRQYSGYRPTDCEEGADFSQHKFGRAVDLHLVLRPEKVIEIRYRIIHKEICAGLITRIEENVPWLHIDCGLPDENGKITILYP